MTKMEPHEDLKDAGKLVQYKKDMGKAAFVSHQWVGYRDPDPEFRQMRVLQDALRNMTSDLKHIYQDIHAEMLLPNSGLKGSEFRSEPLFLWYDYFCCPQLEKTDFPKAIDSIPAYVAKCAFFFVLVPVIESPSMSKVFTPASWAARG
ncbi:unnamed protein product, partial [Symbiodinium pilosum]